MLKIYFVILFCVGLLAFLGECSVDNTVADEKLPPLQQEYIISNNVPDLEPGCEYKFKCKKKLTSAELPKPCLKTCVDLLTCNNIKRAISKGVYCVEFNEQMVAQEHDEELRKMKKAGAVALIDFPCQPGYLPDSRGRCREVW